MTDFIRVWKEVEVGDITEHLLVVGDVSGDCCKCRALGIDYAKVKACPECGTDFKYIASRTGQINRIKSKRPDLIFIDLDDYKKAVGKIKAKGLFL
jgi:NAD(P)H-hydrate repair Nnr-like enzyme with NAD(P)H-hydrate dehydratase domain